MGAAVSSHDTTRPFFERRISFASASTSRCFITAGSETGNGLAISLTDMPSCSASRARMARRVGSDRAANVAPRLSF
jgi:hypothetical protein